MTVVEKGGFIPRLRWEKKRKNKRELKFSTKERLRTHPSLPCRPACGSKFSYTPHVGETLLFPLSFLLLLPHDVKYRRLECFALSISLLFTVTLRLSYLWFSPCRLTSPPPFQLLQRFTRSYQTGEFVLRLCTSPFGSPFQFLRLPTSLISNAETSPKVALSLASRLFRSSQVTTITRVNGSLRTYINS